MPLLRFAEWKPDVSDYEGSSTKTIQNVMPQADGYGPFGSFAQFTSSLPAPCRGGFYALNADGSVSIFAATADKIYQLDNTTFAWKPVSVPAACTISIASPAVVTMTNTFVANDPVVFSTTGALPTGLTAGTRYYVSATGLSGSSFRVSATAGGASINTSGTQSGTQSCTSNYAALSATAQWQFAQTGNLVFATQANVALQVFTVGTSTAFGNALGSPPQAAYISVVGQFLVLSGLLSQPFRIQWSGLASFNAANSWTAGVNSSDFQDFPDGGVVRGVAGGDQSGIVFQDQIIRSMAYVGAPIIFQISKITEGLGLLAPYSLVRSGGNILFYSGKGFHIIAPGGQPTPIGFQRVDKTFIADLDVGNMQLFMGAADPRSSRVFFAYKSVSGSTGKFDKMLGYDSLLDRFFPVAISGQYLLGLSQAGITLEGLDAINSNIDAMTLSLDAYPTSVQPQIAQFDDSGHLGFFTGPALEATIQTAEQGTDFQRLDIRGFMPITDASTAIGSIFYRDTQQATPVQSSSVGLSRIGRCDMMRDTRYARFQIKIPAASTWTVATGVVPDADAGAIQ